MNILWCGFLTLKLGIFIVLPLDMRVLKRTGELEQMCLNKITERLNKLRELEPALNVDAVLVAQKTCAGLRDGISTSKIDEISSEVAVSLTTTDPDYESLAARILISDLHKRTSDDVHETFTRLHTHVNEHGEVQPLVNDEVMQAVSRHHVQLQDAMVYRNDYEYSYFGFKTLAKGYLQPKGAIIERPQHMLLRVALGIWKGDIDRVLSTYALLSSRKYTHATPSLFNLGTCSPHSASCYLMGTEDSVEGLGNAWTKASKISKGAGGIGFNVSNVRGTGSLIRGTGGRSNGIVPLARTFNMLTSWINQGGKRNGALALYLEPWHTDVFDFVQLRRPQGAEDLRARNVFLGLWLNDVFMSRVQRDEMWSIMDPDRCPGLVECWGEDFRVLYERYEKEGRYVRQMKAQALWTMILRCQIESGLPYLLNKDAANATSNHQNLGTIRCSNLCCEVVQYSDADNTSVCNLASMALSRFVRDGEFDHADLHATVQQVVHNLDHMLDVCAYPTKDAMTTNLRDRPLGVGVQGLADALIALSMPFESDQAASLNRAIFETMYHAALTASAAIAARHGPYPSYAGSPIERGLLQFDMWKQSGADGRPEKSSGMWDWGVLRKSIQQHGIRNSMLIANMPTCSTSQILGMNESFQPINSNIYSRRTGAGSFVCVNKPLVKDLQGLGLWSTEMKDEIIRRDGSIQGIQAVPQHLQELYKTVWEIKQRSCIDMAADRAPFVCQSQSMNLFLPEASIRRLSAMLMHAWQRRLITLSYYCHIRPEARAVQVTTLPACVACSA